MAKAKVAANTNLAERMKIGIGVGWYIVGGNLRSSLHPTRTPHHGSGGAEPSLVDRGASGV